MRVVSNDLGNPSLFLSGAAASLAEAKGIAHVHLSMSHDAGVAIAYVVAEGDQTGPMPSFREPHSSGSVSLGES
jgi:holo-[acyl-carrier protein] synthase